jgi:hypothetical protein
MSFLLRITVKNSGMIKLSWARTAISSLLVTSISILAGCDHAGGRVTSAPAPLKAIGFITDFDTRDDAVGICRAVMQGIAPGVKIIDISHQVNPFDVAEGARFLAGSAPYFAKDAIFVAVLLS